MMVEIKLSSLSSVWVNPEMIVTVAPYINSTTIYLATGKSLDAKQSVEEILALIDPAAATRPADRLQENGDTDGFSTRPASP